MRIGDHSVLRRASLGATSEVFEGCCTSDGHAVAIKVLREEWREHTEMVARFLNEARALEHVRHANIVTIFDSGTLPEGLPFMILEWLPVDLHHALANAGGALSLRVAVRVAVQIGNALAVLHDRGLVHRDLKPANVLLDRADLGAARIKLADLGLAKVLIDKYSLTYGEAGQIAALPVSTGGSAVLGTCEYMAPEQWVESKRVDPKADIYSLGVLFFQMLAGRLPFVADGQKDWMCYHVLAPPPLHVLEGAMPARVVDLVARMLSKKPSPRPTMREVLDLLAEFST
ncbi:serine/threonine-protein kinase [Polyangium fumosum]|uniref:Serine/threonine protein kinase n=1 Tax=Polyangium fumosum TaxID=889272 RepID=A0A4U1JBL1_9BACT|nr:serine/threonine-protein kinase [Polyangium fumosum]TKD05304.1 serine/threonine protein kinase [Polyangium fumosum]